MRRGRSAPPFGACLCLGAGRARAPGSFQAEDGRLRGKPVRGTRGAIVAGVQGGTRLLRETAPSAGKETVRARPRAPPPARTALGPSFVPSFVPGSQASSRVGACACAVSKCSLGHLKGSLACMVQGKLGVLSPPPQPGLVPGAPPLPKRHHRASSFATQEARGPQTPLSAASVARLTPVSSCCLDSSGLCPVLHLFTAPS